MILTRKRSPPGFPSPAAWYPLTDYQKTRSERRTQARRDRHPPRHGRAGGGEMGTRAISIPSPLANERLCDRGNLHQDARRPHARHLTRQGPGERQAERCASPRRSCAPAGCAARSRTSRSSCSRSTAPRKPTSSTWRSSSRPAPPAPGGDPREPVTGVQGVEASNRAVAVRHRPKKSDPVPVAGAGDGPEIEAALKPLL